MKTTLLLVLSLAGASAAYAQNPLTTELRQGYNEIKDAITKAAAEMPEADYAFAPGPGSRPYGATVLHAAVVQAAVCGMASGKTAPKFDQTKTSKTDVVAAVKAAFDFCDPIYLSATDVEGTKMVKMFGRDRTMFGTLDMGVIHSNETYGTLAAYLRAKSKVPPTSQK
ncbi:MAG: DinB family protein [Bryobacterales bacterium]|nr:DinB family protein [Bryobacterales bacterium]